VFVWDDFAVVVVMMMMMRNRLLMMMAMTMVILTWLTDVAGSHPAKF
jgi:hypothetical protein